jgi:predicted dehydrogenase
MIRTSLKAWRPFAGQSELAQANFKNRCQMWRKRQEAITIAIEGAGHVFWGYYWPALKKHAAEREMVHVWLNDVGPLSPTEMDELSPYRENIRYLDKNIPADFSRYQDIHPSIVLVLVPDVIHLKQTQYWIQPDRWIGRTQAIFVEKPLDRSLLHAMQVANSLSKQPTLLVPFDHYVAKVFNVCSERRKILKTTGPISSVEFAITEPKKIEEDRRGLEYGMIFDMLCHALGIASILVDLDTKLIEEVEAKAGKYEGARQDVGDTFNWIRMYVKSKDGTIEIKGHTGKAVGPKGSSDEKYIAFKGRKGMLSIEFAPQERIVFSNDAGDRPLKMTDGTPLKITNGYDFFLDKLIKGRYCSSPAGAVPYQTAVNILTILTEARSSTVGSLKTYSANSSRDEILRAIGCQ